MLQSHYPDLGVSPLDTGRAVVRAAAKYLPPEVRADPCRRLLRRMFYCAMLRRHAEIQRAFMRTRH
ncbi:hypothetical protein [Neoaquamicrobium sediminum]|jgi:hypothetical protein|uniref:hypothetical protein n=1 Tax=Neoaquamicrobium sediminum TaxID=1849104 RepID=UPI00156498E8|nr:hypothetical protein [Mesorhizobium sediminum]NRC52908.1 hypothetical protein [Mesorhizobium sediminum]